MTVVLVLVLALVVVWGCLSAVSTYRARRYRPLPPLERATLEVVRPDRAGGELGVTLAGEVARRGDFSRWKNP